MNHQNTLTTRTVPDSQKDKHPVAIIINLTGHRLPQNVFDRLKSAGHTNFFVFGVSIHIDMDGDIHQQCYEYTTELLNQTTKDGRRLLELEGEIYYVSAGHAQASLIIYNAIAALLGYNPSMIVMGINKYRFQSYECKKLFNLQSWCGKWRSTERNKYFKLLQVG